MPKVTFSNFYVCESCNSSKQLLLLCIKPFIQSFYLDDSQSTSPEDGAGGASPRINRFLAREPPDGCEKVSNNSF